MLTRLRFDTVSRVFLTQSFYTLPSFGVRQKFLTLNKIAKQNLTGPKNTNLKPFALYHSDKTHLVVYHNPVM